MSNIGDLVKIPKGITPLGCETQYLYGEIVELQSRDLFAKVELSEPYKGARNTVVPRYMTVRVSPHEYELKTGFIKLPDGLSINIECDHNWVFCGHSFNKDIPMYDCKICGMKKEDI